ncbi:MAG: VWA domain-containing protein [Candidatus Micrarchaeia archaeon]
MKEEERAAQLCGTLLHSYDRSAMAGFMSACRRIGLHLARAVKLIPPNVRRMRDGPFDGTGNINVYKTMNVFLSRGKDITKIVGRKRVVDARVLHLAVLFDDSNSMSAWWRSERLGRPVRDSESPHSFAKVAVAAVAESFGKQANSLTLVAFGSKAKLFKRLDFRELIALNGSGATRLDLALEELRKIKWERRGGAKFLLVLTDGVPEAGNENAREDAAIQRRCADLMAYYARLGVRVLYITLTHEKALAEKKIGEHTCESYAQLLRRRHVVVAEAKDIRALGSTLFTALKEAAA